MHETLRLFESDVQFALGAREANVAAEETSSYCNFCRGFPARNTRNEKPRPLSNGFRLRQVPM
jgi:hypothetical protein